MSILSITREKYDELAAFAEPHRIPVLELAQELSHWRNRDRPVEEVAAELGAAQAEMDARTQAHEDYLQKRRESGEARRAHRAAATHRRSRQKGTPRDRSVTIRVSSQEYEKLTRKAQQLQISLSAYLVDSGLGRRIRPTSSSPEQRTAEVQSPRPAPPTTETHSTPAAARADRGLATETTQPQRRTEPTSHVYWSGGPPQHPIERPTKPTATDPDLIPESSPTTATTHPEQNSPERPHETNERTERPEPEVASSNDTAQLNLTFDDCGRRLNTDPPAPVQK